MKIIEKEKARQKEFMKWNQVEEYEEHKKSLINLKEHFKEEWNFFDEIFFENMRRFGKKKDKYKEAIKELNQMIERYA